MQLGFLPRSLDVSDRRIAIRCIADWREMLANIVSRGHVRDGWLYLPRNGSRAYRYELPTAHEIEARASQDEEELRFLILVLGFLEGLRLLPAGWGHLHPTAVAVGKCNNFLVKDSEILPCLDLAANFYTANRQSRNVKRLLSAISLLHWSRIQPLQFDEFNYLYMALDACWAICADVHPIGKKNPRHHERPSVMSGVLNLSLPPIFDPSSAVTVFSIRNDLVHEGLVGDLPIGLTVMPNCTLEMLEFVEKLILSLLGVKAGYLATRGGDRQRHFLDLDQ